MLIRSVNIQDMAGLYALECNAFGDHCFPDFFFRQALDLWPSLLLVAEPDAGALAGYVLAVPSDQADEAWILSLAVNADFRGQGLGRRLLVDVLAILEAKGFTQIKLTVHPDNPARQLYADLGFREAGFEEAHFGQGEPRVLMVR